jgi:hypothetical protein
MKTLVMIGVIIWFVLGANSADNRGYFGADYPRDCSHLGSAALTVVGGPLNYTGLDPHAYC